MKIIVQKYGGTSVNKPELRKKIIDNAQKAQQDGLMPVLVVSAMGRKGEAYATDTLLSLLPDPLAADARTKDFLITCGENITCAVLAEELRAEGFKAYALNGLQAGIQANGVYGNSDILYIDTALLTSLLKDGIIPVVAGFQGRGENLDIVTLGRGGSDISATALGQYLGAQSVEIYTDVAGIMTADPRVVQDCRILERVDYNTIYTLAEQGAKVIHPRAISFAQKGNIPVRVLSTALGYGSSCTTITDAGTNVNDTYIAVTSKGIDDQKSKISLIGKNLLHVENLEAAIKETLLSKGIDATDICIEAQAAGCIVAADNEKLAVAALHKKFIGASA